MPKPDSGETHDSFMERCMANDVMNREYEDTGQRVKVCESLWQDKDKGARPMEFKTISLKDASIEGRTITGYAAAFGNIDHGRDVIKKGSFKKTLKERGDRVKVFYNHMTPIGKPEAMKEDDNGLYTESRISGTPKGDEVLELAKDGVITEMSFAYEAVDYQINEKDGVRTLKEVKLYEYGPVDFAMNEQATISGVKALADRLYSNKPVNSDNLAALRSELKSLLDAIDSMGPSQDTPHDDGPSVDTRVMSLPEEITGRLAEAFRVNQ